MNLATRPQMTYAACSALRRAAARRFLRAASRVGSPAGMGFGVRGPGGWRALRAFASGEALVYGLTLLRPGAAPLALPECGPRR